jgi:hydrogenase-4 component B
VSNELLIAAVFAWLLAGLVAATRRALILARTLLVTGCVLGIFAAIAVLPGGTPSMALPWPVAGETIAFGMSPNALWLMGFGLVAAALACALSSPVEKGQAGWIFAAAASLLGALGVFGLRNGGALLIAWEVMSLGGALLILSERLSAGYGRAVLFMLAVLEAGAVALLLAILILADRGFNFDAFQGAAAALPFATALFVGLLLLAGFGAKLGVLPFFEWFPNLYQSGSGASGALLSGVVLNAAYFGLAQSLVNWFPADATALTPLGVILIGVGVLSAVLTALYAFQQEDWRALLSFSSAENAAIAVTMLGACLVFRSNGLMALASLAWVVALLHLAAHSLAKGALFLAADGVYHATGSYAIAQTGLLRRSSWMFGFGALLAAMSLAAMPPLGGFVSEWYVFQTLFQGFRLSTLGGRLTMALAGAGLALTVAVALATSVKLFGIGLLGRRRNVTTPVPPSHAAAVGALGIFVLALGVGMPWWLGALDLAAVTSFGTDGATAMRDGLLLVPLTAKFSFISPTMLAIMMPLLSLIPVVLYMANSRYAVRNAPVWYGGLAQNPERASTTALTFSNALRTFYSFVYRPREELRREAKGSRYFIRRLEFTHDVAPFFGPYIFRPLTESVIWLADRLRPLQSGDLNLYLAIIGVLLVIILALVLV